MPGAAGERRQTSGSLWRFELRPPDRQPSTSKTLAEFSFADTEFEAIFKFFLGCRVEMNYIASIRGLLRKTDRTLMDSWRPLAFSFSFSNVYEEAVLESVTGFMMKKRMSWSSKELYGCMPNRKPTCAFIDIVTMLGKELMHGNDILAALLGSEWSVRLC